MKGSASAPSSATMNGTRCAISPAMKATSRESRSSLETITGHLAERPVAKAAARRGRRSSASAPFAGFDLDVFGDDLDSLGFGEPRDCGFLGFDAKTRALLLLCGDTIVGNSALHTNCIPPFAVCMKLNSEQ